MTVRIGVIGTGMIGRDHTRRIQQVLAGAEVVALSDYSPDAARGVQADLAPGAKVYETGAELIAAPDVDAVLVTSTGATHEAYVLAAIAAGKPCFCEKPLATTADGAKRIVDAEVTHGKRLVQVGFMRRYDAGYVALKQATAQIGAPIMVHAAHRNPTVPEAYGTPMAIHDTLIHEIDVFRWLLDDGYDIQCEIVGEDGIARLPEPMAIQLRLDAKLQNPILTDWKDRFVDSYDVELNDFIKAAAKGTAAGPSSWDGYVAAITSDACVTAQGTAGEAVAITLPDRPALYR